MAMQCVFRAAPFKVKYTARIYVVDKAKRGLNQSKN